MRRTFVSGGASLGKCLVPVEKSAMSVRGIRECPDRVRFGDHPL
ncbi:hypothetical protein RRSWK_02032 [Rhodopirellula sp. SWK7]|nr:hypothetical protein RRSWK_02032 [Rhodopirellula sp. SWK7]